MVTGFTVSNTLGQGHKESVYQKALANELSRKGIHYRREVPLPVKYQGENVGVYKPDFIIEDKIIVEIKAVEALPAAHEQQLVHYLKNTGYIIGFLVNFGSPNLIIRRKIWTPHYQSSV